LGTASPILSQSFSPLKEGPSRTLWTFFSDHDGGQRPTFFVLSSLVLTVPGSPKPRMLLCIALLFPMSADVAPISFSRDRPSLMLPSFFSSLTVVLRRTLSEYLWLDFSPLWRHIYMVFLTFPRPNKDSVPRILLPSGLSSRGPPSFLPRIPKPYAGLFPLKIELWFLFMAGFCLLFPLVSLVVVFLGVTTPAFFGSWGSQFLV